MGSALSRNHREFIGGWPDLNTTRCGADAGYSGEISILADASVGVICVSRRTIITTDAFQTT